MVHKVFLISFSEPQSVSFLKILFPLHLVSSLIARWKLAQVLYSLQGRLPQSSETKGISKNRETIQEISRLSLYKLIQRLYGTRSILSAYREASRYASVALTAEFGARPLDIPLESDKLFSHIIVTDSSLWPSWHRGFTTFGVYETDPSLRLSPPIRYRNSFTHIPQRPKL